MEKFNQINIQATGDVTIVEGSNLEVNSSHKIIKGCLIVLSTDDVTVKVPRNTYKEISIQTVNGDGVIDLKDITVEKIAFRSVNGDLSVNAVCYDVSFYTVNGSYCGPVAKNNYEAADNDDHAVMRIKQELSTIRNQNPTWKGDR